MSTTATGSVTFLANQGSAYNYQNRRIRINWKEVTDDDANTSALSITSVELYSDVGAMCYIYGTITINGTVVIRMNGDSTTTNRGITTSKSGQWVQLYQNRESGTGTLINPIYSDPVTITHADDGTASVTIGIAANTSGTYFTDSFANYMPQRSQYSDTSNKYAAATQTVNMTTISTWKAGTMSFSQSSIADDGSSVSISIANTGLRTSYHKLAFAFGTGSGLTAGLSASTGILKGNNVATFTVASSVGAYLTTAKQGTATFTLSTYKEQACTTLVGTSTATITITFPETTYKPTGTSGWAATAYYNTGTQMASIGQYVKGFSKAHTTFDSTKIALVKGATIASYKTTLSGTSYTGNPSTTGTINVNSATLTRTVTDSRGFTLEDTITLTLLDYAAPTITAVTGSRSGSSLIINATAGCTSLGGENSVTLQAQWKVRNGTYSTAATITSGVDNTIYQAASGAYTYIILLTATDTPGNSATFTLTVAGDTIPISFKPGGTGIALGKASTRDNLFEVALPVCGQAASLAGYDTAIASGADLDDYKEVGTYAIASNAIAGTLGNRPCSIAGALIVKDGMNTVTNTVTSYDCYRLQIYITYTGSELYMRCLSRTGGTTQSWNPGSWYRFSGTAI